MKSFERCVANNVAESLEDTWEGQSRKYIWLLKITVEIDKTEEKGLLFPLKPAGRFTKSPLSISLSPPSLSLSLSPFLTLSPQSQSPMDSISPAITSNLLFPATKPLYDHSTTSSLSFSPVIHNLKSKNLIRTRVLTRASSEIKSTSSPIDFSDPDWKIKYEKDFESRFHLPHLTDVYADAVSYPSTFCLRMR